ncbi:UNVERIFIED_CONTAM: hypothetical protein FKN15_060493 [Acipenser sinensis]
MARLSTATRHKVVLLHQQGLSQAEISRQTGVSRCAVQALLKKHKETGNVEDRRRSGRPRKLTAADERHIMLTSLRNRKMSSSAISSELAENSGTLPPAPLNPSDMKHSDGEPLAERARYSSLLQAECRNRDESDHYPEPTPRGTPALPPPPPPHSTGAKGEKTVNLADVSGSVGPEADPRYQRKLRQQKFRKQMAAKKQQEEEQQQRAQAEPTAPPSEQRPGSHQQSKGYLNVSS